MIRESNDIISAIEAAFASCSGFTSTRSARRSVRANGCASSMNACGPSQRPNNKPMTSCFSVERAWATTQKAHSLARVQWARDMMLRVGWRPQWRLQGSRSCDLERLLALAGVRSCGYRLRTAVIECCRLAQRARSARVFASALGLASVLHAGSFFFPEPCMQSLIHI